MEKHAFYLVYREYSRRARLSFNIGGKASDFAVVTVEGKVAKEAFPGLVSLLARYGAVWPDEVTDKQRVYVVRDDYAPIIGAYMLTLRRARSYGRWLKTLEKLLNDETPGLALALPRFLEMAIDLAKVWESKNGKSGEKKALDVVASTLRYFTELVEKPRVNSRQRKAQKKTVSKTDGRV